MSDEFSNKDWQTAKKTYYGKQFWRGGGEFVGDDSASIEDAIQSVSLPPEPAQDEAQSRVQAALAPDELDAAFAELRIYVAAAMPEVSRVIDLLVAELRRGLDNQDGISAAYVQAIGAMLAGIGAAGRLRAILLAAPVEQIIGALTRSAAEQLPEP